MRMVGFNDGSPSTAQVDGSYSGEWDQHHQRPQGRGKMVWDNGITYLGGWKDGKYHGHGGKQYSRGGGYLGQWRDGRREGRGVSLYEGKFGFDRWEGPFVADLPHGVGRMFHEDDPAGAGVPFEFLKGQPKSGQHR